MSLALQHTKRAQTASAMMLLSPGRSGLTTRQAEWSCADTKQFLALRAYPIQPAHLHGRQGQAIGGRVLLAVSDHPDFKAPAQPARLGPVGGSPMLTNRVAIEPAILLQTTDDRPPIVANALQEGSGGIPRIKQDVVRAAAQAVAGLAEHLAGEDIS
jgi:hypothetical protein